ncbi:hypothetical protein RD792_010727 [Penstemon davidsonii]|uniref:RING-type domain-containing protein n=1 Tax=Penstemon davidsonii TaxID=160366 RepID=A0ABR0D2X8_9LAMI|nr:hypothetical protein RD792_010727 [Penstemon davidsonii]
MEILKTIIFFFTFLLFQTIQARNECPSRFCGKNQFAIRFPFLLQGHQPQNCGYPGFNLSCTSQKPEVVINIPDSGDFLVGDINYMIQEIQLFDPNGCLPKRLMSLNLSSSPFTFTYSQNFTFLSCPIDLVMKSRLTTIDCLGNSTASVVATSSMDHVKAMNMCSTIVSMPIPVSWPHRNEWLAFDFKEDLRLTWDVPNCVDCESKGGICGFQNSTSNQTHCFIDTITGQSRGLQIFRIIVLSIVIPAIMCSIIISCFLCFIGRRRHVVVSAPRNGTAAVAPQTPDTTIIGLDDSTIESYTKVILGESRRLPGPNGATCPICLVDYDPKDIIRCIPQCEHCFHSDCIDEWLRMNGTCPLCRNSPSPSRPV